MPRPPSRPPPTLPPPYSDNPSLPSSFQLHPPPPPTFTSSSPDTLILSASGVAAPPSSSSSSCSSYSQPQPSFFYAPSSQPPSQAPSRRPSVPHASSLPPVPPLPPPFVVSNPLSSPSPSQPQIENIDIAALSTLPKQRKMTASEEKLAGGVIHPSETHLLPKILPRFLLNKHVSVANLEYHLLPHVHSTRSVLGWRLNLARLMHTHFVQNLLMLLLLCDVCLVVAGIVLEGFDSECVATNFREDCARCTSPLAGSCPVEFDKELTPTILHAVGSLTIGSITILCLFALELILLLIALGWRFFANFFYVLDTVVIAVSLWAEINAYRNHHLAEEALPLLIILRVWRFARIFHGVGIVVHDREERHIEDLQLIIDKQQSRIKKLEELQGKKNSEVRIHDQRSEPAGQGDDDALLSDHI